MTLSAKQLTVGMALLSVSAMGPLALAADRQAPSAVASAVFAETNTRLSSEMRSEARDWGLNDRDLERYDTLMQGVRGLWSPNLDPITVLGVEARTEEERRRYAEMLVEVEKQRVERELAFQRAYDDAWQRLYPDAMPVTPFLMKGGDTGESLLSDVGLTQGSRDRVTVHVASDDCRECDAVIDELIASGTPMDVFVIDTGNDDQVIRAWARERAIPAERVRARQITLNHGYPLPSLGVTEKSVPQVFKQ